MNAFKFPGCTYLAYQTSLDRQLTDVSEVSLLTFQLWPTLQRRERVQVPHDERGPPAAVAHLRRDAGQIFGLLLEGVRRRLRHDAQKNLRNKTSLRQPGKIESSSFFQPGNFCFCFARP